MENSIVAAVDGILKYFQVAEGEELKFFMGTLFVGVASLSLWGVKTAYKCGEITCEEIKDALENVREISRQQDAFEVANIAHKARAEMAQTSRKEVMRGINSDLDVLKSSMYRMEGIISSMSQIKYEKDF